MRYTTILTVKADSVDQWADTMVLDVTDGCCSVKLNVADTGITFADEAGYESQFSGVINGVHLIGLVANALYAAFDADCETYCDIFANPDRKIEIHHTFQGWDVNN